MVSIVRQAHGMAHTTQLDRGGAFPPLAVWCLEYTPYEAGKIRNHD